MKELSEGAKGAEVLRLQQWLTKFDSTLVTDGKFGANTKRIVQQAQASLGLKPDGVVGPRTLAAFMLGGYLPTGFVQPVQLKSDYPNLPKYKSLTTVQKTRKFGNPVLFVKDGKIAVDPDFMANVVSLDLADWFPNATKDNFGARHIQINKKVVLQWKRLFDEIVNKGLADRIISCAGSHVIRFVRGSDKTLSSHSFATAVDFNAQQNWLGAQPAKKGEHGSLVEIIELLPNYDMFSGIWFSRVDGMHIESTCTDDELGIERKET